MSDSFSDWTAKLAEALCVEHGIPCKRRFTDMELERPLAELRAQRYGDAMSQRDKLARHEGRPDHDMSASHGTPLKEGT